MRPNSNSPAVTVLMSVNRLQPHVAEAIESILTQTYKDFVFLIIDDGSTDKTADVLATYREKDTRIKLHRLTENKGLGFALAEGVKLAQTEFVARMDADDIALPDRLAQQLAYFAHHPEVDVLGTAIIEMTPEGNPIRLRSVPTSHAEITRLIWTCPLFHPTVMFRRAKILQIGNYKPQQRRRQDYDLWFRGVAAGLHFANLPQPLLHYRFSTETLRRSSLKSAWQQLVIGLRGCWNVRAGVSAYAGVLLPFILNFLPVKWRATAREKLARFDPRDTHKNRKKSS